MSLDKALDELMDGDIIVFQKYVFSDVPLYHAKIAEVFWSVL